LVERRAVAVGYSEAQISRLEGNQRPPDLAAVAALLVPALDLRDEPEVVARLLELAAQARGEVTPAHLTVTQTVTREVHTPINDGSQRAALPLARTSFVDWGGPAQMSPNHTLHFTEALGCIEKSTTDPCWCGYWPKWPILNR
jgi:hypothetical protein